MSDAVHERDRADRRALYQKVCRIVDYQTGGPQPALVPEHVIVTIATDAGHDPDHVRSALLAAVGNEDLLEWDDHYALADEASVRAVITAEADRTDPRFELIGHCNGLLDRLREGDHAE